MRIKYKEKGKNAVAEILITDNKTFLFRENMIKKLTNKVENSNIGEVNEAVTKQKSKQNVEINPRIFELLKKELGEYEIII